MKKTFAILAILQALLLGAFGQTAADPLERTYLEHDEPNEILRLKWWGRSGSTYFIQHSDDLVNWNWFPAVEVGADSVMEYGVTYNPTPTSKLFLRLKMATIPTSNPNGDDFDGDGASNLAEVQMGLDPLNADSDGDGMSYGWEITHGLDPLLKDARLNPDGDGSSNITEYLAGTNPQVADGEVGTSFVTTELRVFTPLE